MTAALMYSTCEETFQFSAGQRTVRVSAMSSWYPAADCSTLTDQRLWTERKRRRVETAETGLIIDARYGATSWWRHLYTRIQILRSMHAVAPEASEDCHEWS